MARRRELVIATGVRYAIGRRGEKIEILDEFVATEAHLSGMFAYCLRTKMGLPSSCRQSWRLAQHASSGSGTRRQLIASTRRSEARHVLMPIPGVDAITATSFATANE